MTTADPRGRPHVAPMGPVVDRALENWLLRPFQTSSTFANLRSKPQGVFHVTDDVLTVVRSVLGLPLQVEFTRQAEGVWVIRSTCHWYQLQVTDWDLRDARSEARAVVVAQGALRPFWGWNRAKHAILEAAILVTRLHLLDLQQIRSEFERLRPAVEKTAGDRELEAWGLLCNRIASSNHTDPER